MHHEKDPFWADLKLRQVPETLPRGREEVESPPALDLEGDVERDAASAIGYRTGQCGHGIAFLPVSNSVKVLGAGRSL